MTGLMQHVYADWKPEAPDCAYLGVERDIPGKYQDGRIPASCVDTFHTLNTGHKGLGVRCMYPHIFQGDCQVLDGTDALEDHVPSCYHLHCSITGECRTQEHRPGEQIGLNVHPNLKIYCHNNPDSYGQCIEAEHDHFMPKL